MKFTGPVKSQVSNRGIAPDAFLSELIAWGRAAPLEIFSPNSDPQDVFDVLKPVLGKWTSLLHRRAAMLELMRVHAGFEASWNWNEGVDRTNATSMRKIQGQETGIFQVSFDSLFLDDERNTGDDLHQCVMRHCGSLDILKFISLMKSDHDFAMEYYARLMRNNYKWAGPVVRGEILPWLRRDALTQFIDLLA